MTLSHVIPALPYIGGLIVALCLLCVVADPFPTEEPEALQLGEEWM